MAVKFQDLPALRAHGFDAVIDVRSPAEFAQDRLPGAINLPVLDNHERARVGTIYTQESRFTARKIGAALVIRNIARHLDGPLAEMPKGWRPLVYCWRGGQRSGTFRMLMREIGWQAESLEGGYRSYRRLVVGLLHERPLPWRLVVLAGMTCTAKTALLQALAGHGVQMLDLEGLACHRGSVFGAMEQHQPAQKGFESAIAEALLGLDPARPVLVEAESSKIGDLFLPPTLWAAMRAAPRVGVAAPLAARARFFTRAYADLVADRARFAALLEQLIPLQGRAQVEQWQAQLAAGEAEAVAAGLMQAHYDPRYARSMAAHGTAPLSELQLDSLSPEAIAAAAPELARRIAQADAGRGAKGLGREAARI